MYTVEEEEGDIGASLEYFTAQHHAQRSAPPGWAWTGQVTCVIDVLQVTKVTQIEYMAVFLPTYSRGYVFLIVKNGTTESGHVTLYL